MAFIIQEDSNKMQKGPKCSALSISPDSPRKVKVVNQTPKHKHTSSLITPKSSTFKFKPMTTFSSKPKVSLNKFVSPSTATLKPSSRHKHAFSEHMPSSVKNANLIKKKQSRSPEKKSVFKTMSLPITPETALTLFKQKLTQFEYSEILNYPYVYYLGNLSGKIKPLMVNNNGFDDEQGDFKIVIGDHIAYRFEIKSVLGQGSFGQVVKVFDHKAKKDLALKIIKNRPRFHQQALEEIEILNYIKDKDPESLYCVVHIQENFIFRNHAVILK